MNRSRFLFPLAGLLVGLTTGWVFFPAVLYRSEEQPLQFSHAVHTDTGGMACADCHSFDADGRFVGIPTTAQCASCHADVMGETENEKRFVEEYVKTSREVPWKVYARQPDNAYFPHAAHVTRGGIACESCHGPHGTSTTLRPYQVNRITGYSRDIWGSSIARIGMEPWEGMKMDKCISCHRETERARACLDCHK